jgi:hypothetical protein
MKPTDIRDQSDLFNLVCAYSDIPAGITDKNDDSALRSSTGIVIDDVTDSLALLSDLMDCYPQDVGTEAALMHRAASTLRLLAGALMLARDIDDMVQSRAARRLADEVINEVSNGAH